MFNNSSPGDTFESFSSLARVAARATTNAIRTLEPDQSGTGGFLINGTAWAMETYVHIRWGWIAFPASMIAVTVVFFVMTVIIASRSDVEVGKSSTLPIFCALNSRIRGIAGPVSSLSELEIKMRGVYAKLASGEFIFTTDQEPSPKKNPVPGGEHLSDEHADRRTSNMPQNDINHGENAQNELIEHTEVINTAISSQIPSDRDDNTACDSECDGDLQQENHGAVEQLLVIEHTGQVDLEQSDHSHAGNERETTPE
ncbi:hypothetical protein ABKA04_007782 [Annulohypoxylon sp. FPYF3050]